jgi:hypothetical protein
MRGMKQRLDSIRLMADGVVPLDLGCLSSREARLGPVSAAYTRSCIVVATDGSLKKSGAMGAAFVAKDNRLPSRTPLGEGSGPRSGVLSILGGVGGIGCTGPGGPSATSGEALCHSHSPPNLQPKRGRTEVEASPPMLPITAAWMLRPNQGRSTLGQILGEMRISTAKNLVVRNRCSSPLLVRFQVMQCSTSGA